MEKFYKESSKAEWLNPKHTLKVILELKFDTVKRD